MYSKNPIEAAVMCVVLALAVAACGVSEGPHGPVPDTWAELDAPADTATDDWVVPDVPADSATDTGGETDGPALIIPDCSLCPAVGTDLENLRCAIDLCDDSVFLGQEYSSPTVTRPEKLARSREAVERFGDVTNDLAPLLGGSYAVMATGYATRSVPPDDWDHDQSLGATLWQPDGPSVPDPHASSSEYPSYDVLEWSLHLRAPSTAHGFQVHYVFFSVEYDEYVGREFNDKFYMLLQASSTAGMEHPIINFTDCRPTVTSPDFTCPAGMPACDVGEELCYLAINSALSECCWYDGCTTMSSNTDIGGTGFECGTAEVDYVGDYSFGFTYGSSTGWLVTEWPIEPNEEFTITFHIHDTADSILDSEVVIDKFVFTTEANPGTSVLI